MVRDRIVFGTNSPVMREKLINKGSDLTLDITMDIAKTHELSQSQLCAMGNEKVEVHGVTPKHRGRTNYLNRNKTVQVKVKDTGLVQTVGLSTIKQAYVQPREKSITFATNTITLLKCVGQKLNRKYTEQYLLTVKTRQLIWKTNSLWKWWKEIDHSKCLTRCSQT